MVSSYRHVSSEHVDEGVRDLRVDPMAQQFQPLQANVGREALCEVDHAGAAELVVGKVEIKERRIILDGIRKALQGVVAEVALG